MPVVWRTCAGAMWHLAERDIFRSILVQVVAGAPSPQSGPPFPSFWRLVDGRTPLGQSLDIGLTLRSRSTVERAYCAARHDGTSAFFPAAAARYRELLRRCAGLHSSRRARKPRPEQSQAIEGLLADLQPELLDVLG